MSQVSGKDVVSGYDRSDKYLRNKLLDMNFAHYDDKSRPANDAYREGWERCFGGRTQYDRELDNLARTYAGGDTDVPPSDAWPTDSTGDVVSASETDSQAPQSGHTSAVSSEESGAPGR